MLPGASQLLSRLGLVARNGLSLARNDSRLRETHSGVKGPDLLLRSLLPDSAARSALPLRYRCRFAPASAASSLLARYSFAK